MQGACVDMTSGHLVGEDGHGAQSPQEKAAAHDRASARPGCPHTRGLWALLSCTSAAGRGRELLSRASRQGLGRSLRTPPCSGPSRSLKGSERGTLEELESQGLGRLGLLAELGSQGSGAGTPGRAGRVSTGAGTRQPWLACPQRRDEQVTSEGGVAAGRAQG